MKGEDENDGKRLNLGLDFFERVISLERAKLMAARVLCELEGDFAAPRDKAAAKKEAGKTRTVNG